jgi:hypothetical protein
MSLQNEVDGKEVEPVAISDVMKLILQKIDTIIQKLDDLIGK